jgi:uncharacterized membrane protein
MEPTSTASIKTARWFLAALLAVNLYRAMTQSVTPGEAWNYDRFIGPTWKEALARFDVNNHVLNTLLVRLSTSQFHLTELSLRLPSLLAGVFYLWVVFRLARRYFGDGLLFLAVVGLLTLNPVVVDALSEARGYGMALAFWMWALELLLESVESFSPQKLKLAAMCLGLSVAATLAFAAPALALLVVFLAWSNSRTGGSSDAAVGRSPLPSRVFVLIFLLTAFVLLAIPLDRAEWNTLAVGATSLRQTINEITALSLGTSLKSFSATARVAVALVALAGAAASFRYWRRRDGALVVLTGASLALTLVFLIAAHRWLHTPFPQEGAICLIPLTALIVATVILKQHNRAAQIAFLAVSAVLLARYVAEFRFGMYAAGSQFSGARTLAKTLRANARGGSPRIGVSLAAEPIMSYYRTRYRQGNWQPIERQPLTGAYDFYVLTPAAATLVQERHLHVLYRDAGLTLADPSRDR